MNEGSDSSEFEILCSADSSLKHFCITRSWKAMDKNIKSPACSEAESGVPGVRSLTLAPDSMGVDLVRLPRDITWGRILDALMEEGILDIGLKLEIDEEGSIAGGRMVAAPGNACVEASLAWPAVFPCKLTSGEKGQGFLSDNSHENIMNNMLASNEARKRMKEKLEKARREAFESRWERMDLEENAYAGQPSICPGSATKDQKCLGALNQELKDKNDNRKMEARVSAVEKQVEVLTHFYLDDTDVEIKSEESEAEGSEELEYKEIVEKLKGLKTFQAPSKKGKKKRSKNKNKSDKRAPLRSCSPASPKTSIFRTERRSSGSPPTRSGSRYASPNRSRPRSTGRAARRGSWRRDSRSSRRRSRSAGDRSPGRRLPSVKTWSSKSGSGGRSGRRSPGSQWARPSRGSASSSRERTAGRRPRTGRKCSECSSSPCKGLKDCCLEVSPTDGRAKKNNYQR